MTKREIYIFTDVIGACLKGLTSEADNSKFLERCLASAYHHVIMVV